LDYSFTTKHPKGTFVPPSSTPGGGSPALRGQLKILKEFVESFDFIKMKPDPSIFKSRVTAGETTRALAENGRAYAIYVHHGKPGYWHNSSGGAEPRPSYTVRSDARKTSLVLSLPVGSYRVEWVNTKTGRVDKDDSLNTSGEPSTLASPSYQEDIALRVKRK